MNNETSRKAWEALATVMAGPPFLVLMVAIVALPFALAFEGYSYLRFGVMPGSVCDLLMWAPDLDQGLYQAVCRPETGWLGVDRILWTLLNNSTLTYATGMVALAAAGVVVAMLGVLAVIGLLMKSATT